MCSTITQHPSLTISAFLTLPVQCGVYSVVLVQSGGGSLISIVCEIVIENGVKEALLRSPVAVCNAALRA